MKKIFSVILSVCMMCTFFCAGTIVAKAASGTVGNCTWSLNGTELTISGTGTMGDTFDWPWDKNITKLIVEEGVTDIGTSAFSECTKLSSVSLPSTLRTIKSHAFFHCSSLAEITIPEKVASIGRGAFSNCSQIVEINVPKSVTEIDFSAFSYCNSLVGINIDPENPNYSSESGVLFNKNKTVLIAYPTNKMDRTYTIPSSVTKISEFSFDRALRVEKIIIHDNVTHIGQAAFQNTRIQNNRSNYENGVLYIGRHLIRAESTISYHNIKQGTLTIAGGAFTACNALYDIVIPEGVKSIGENAFAWCNNLGDVSLPGSLQYVGEYAFYDCKNLEDIWYAGSMAQKARLALDKTHVELTGATWHYDSCHLTDKHSWRMAVVTSPTCSVEGAKVKVCDVCKNTVTERTGTVPHKYGSWTQTKAPSCTADGSQSRECTECSHTETRKIKAFGHNYINPTVTVEPTCTQSGTEVTTCKKCNQQAANTIKALGHKFGSWADEKDATCTEGGVQKRVCATCSKTESRNTGSLGHKFNDPTVIKDATIYSEGLMQGKCTRCDKVTTEVIACSTADDDTGLAFETSKGVFKEGTTISASEIINKSGYKGVLALVSDEFTLYNISASLNGKKAQPDGRVKVTFPIPKNYGKDVAVYSISDDGKTSLENDIVVSEDGKTVTAELLSLGDVAVCDLSPDTADGEADAQKPLGGWVIWVVVGVLVFAGAVITVILVARKKMKEIL